ncbi:hypothetical protein EJ110_NYTH00741 [Nymphaea thermarum]|nr:hypothetical protein EJ110_NYTH00741 [Nymphaea thermarum]
MAAAFESESAGGGTRLSYQSTWWDEWLFSSFVLLLLMGLCWYVLFEAIVVAAVEQLKRLVVVSPLLLVVVVHWLSLLPDSHIAHRATSGGAGPAWGVAFVLFLLLFVFLL